jgi:restriction endonuclease S subunit
MRRDLLSRLIELRQATIEVDEEATSSSSRFVEIELGDKKHFQLQRGRRVTRTDCDTNKGNIPIVSGRNQKNSYLGFVSEEWLKSQNISVYSEPRVVIAANGSVGSVFLRDEEKYVIHDDAIGIVITTPEIVPEYLQYALRIAAVKAQYQYNAKLYKKRLKSLCVSIPIKEDGSLDRERQTELASRLMTIDSVKDKLGTLIDRLEKRAIVTNLPIE